MDKPKSDFISDVVAAKLEIKHAILDKTNPHFRSKYASLTSVLDAVVRIYAEHNITFEQRSVQKDDGTWVLRTWREHSSGAKDEVPDEQPLEGGTAQQWGSSLTYKRRYGMSTIAGIASEEDDDGNAASDVKPASAYASRKAGFYPIAEKAIREQTTLEGLKQWWVDNQDEIRAMTPRWIEHLEEEKDRRKEEIIRETAEDTELKQQLKGSLV